MRVVLVRHAMPVVADTRPPTEWPLSPAGRAASAALRADLPDSADWRSSSERKAVETLVLARNEGGGASLEDARFGEVVRPGEPFDADFRERRRAWVEGRLDDRHAGWETLEQAGSRFQAAVAHHASGRPLVVATHGMVLTAWLVSIGQVGPGRRAGELWSQLPFPAVVEVTLPDAPTA